MLKKLTIILGVSALCAMPAIASQKFAVTPSGATEMLFPGPASDVASKLSSRCMDIKWTVVSSSNTEILCEAPLGTGQSMVTQLLLGNSYSTPPRRFFKFNVVERSGIARVQPSGWIETQMAFGQMKRVDFTDARFHNGMMGFMAAAGGKPPVGTTYPNHVVMGFDGELVPNGKNFGLRVKQVRPSTPAERAGLQAGDIVLKIAGKDYKNDDEHLDALEKAAKSQTYSVDVLRGREKLTFTLDREFRPAFTEEVAPYTPEPTVTAGSETSVADELAKLHKLKEQGILTDAEFEAQKKKVLER